MDSILESDSDSESESKSENEFKITFDSKSEAVLELKSAIESIYKSKLVSELLYKVIYERNALSALTLKSKTLIDSNLEYMFFCADFLPYTLGFDSEKIKTIETEWKEALQ